jgi:O-antigen ligase
MSNFKVDSILMIKCFIFILSLILMFRDPIPRGFTLVQLIAVTGLMFLHIIHPSKRLAFDSKLYIIGLILMLVWASMTTIVGVFHGTNNFHEGLQDLRDFGVFIFIAIGLITLGIDYGWKQLFWGASLGMILEFFLRAWPHVYLNFFNSYIGLRYTGGFSSPNNYGTMAAIVITASFWKVWTNKKIQVSYIAIIFLSSLVLISTFSRAGIISAIGGILITLIFNRRQVFNFSNWILIILFFCTLILAIHSGYSKFDLLQRRFSPERVIASDNVRLELLHAASEIMIEHPLCGAGWGGFSKLNEFYGGTGTSSPHNELAKVAAESGLPGFVIMAFLLFYPMKIFWKYKEYLIESPVPAMIVTFLIGEIFFSHLARAELSIVFALLLGSSFNYKRKESALKTKVNLSTNYY